MRRMAVGVLAGVMCIPALSDASMIGGTGGTISLQFEPQQIRAWRDDGRPQRPVGDLAGAAAFDPPSVSSPSGPTDVCGAGGCGDGLPVTGNYGGQALPPTTNGWEGGSRDEIFSDAAPGQSNEDLVISTLLPESSDGNNSLGSPTGFGGDGDIGEAPEPSTVLLMSGALLGLAVLRKKRNTSTDARRLSPLR